MCLSESVWGVIGKKGILGVSSWGMVLEGHEHLFQFNK